MAGDVKLRDLVAAAARKNCQPKRHVDRAVRQVLREIQSALAEGKVVSLFDFGQFEVVARPPQEGTDFRTGERIRVPGRPRVRFNSFQRTKRAIKGRAR